MVGSNTQPAAILPCVRGCIIRGQHKPTCAHAGCRDSPCPTCSPITANPTTRPCSGCIPRERGYGLICGPDRGRIIRGLLDARGFAAWLRALVAPGSAEGTRVTGSRTPPAPLRLTALDDLDALHALLWTWVELVMDSRPGAFTPPSWQGSRIVPASTRRIAIPDTAGRYERVYEPARLVGVRAGEAMTPVTATSRWLVDHLDWITTQLWVTGLHDEVTSAIGRIRSAYPIREARQELPVPCPLCDRRSLVLHPVAEEGEEQTVCCHSDDCGAVITMQDYRWHVNRMAEMLKTPRHRRPRPTLETSAPAVSA